MMRIRLPVHAALWKGYILLKATCKKDEELSQKLFLKKKEWEERNQREFFVQATLELPRQRRTFHQNAAVWVLVTAIFESMEGRIPDEEEKYNLYLDLLEAYADRIPVRLGKGDPARRAHAEAARAHAEAERTREKAERIRAEQKRIDAINSLEGRHIDEVLKVMPPPTKSVRHRGCSYISYYWTKTQRSGGGFSIPVYRGIRIFTGSSSASKETFTLMVDPATSKVIDWSLSAT